MFLSLFKMECKQILRSLVYYLFVIVFVLFITSQMSDTEWTESMKAPVEGEAGYGLTVSENPEYIMEMVLWNLHYEAESNIFVTYPLGFYKEVSLSEEELNRVWDIFYECCNESKEEMEELRMLTPQDGMTYEQFEEKMAEVAKIVGRGSSYTGVLMSSLAYEEKTYEDALNDYEKMCTEDKITGAYMRLFCDYSGIVLAFLPIFIGVTRCLRDKRALVDEVTYTKQASSAMLIGVRYVAHVFMVYLPVLITALLIQFPYLYHAETLGVTPDYFAFFTYTAVWLLPEIMIVMAVSFLITEFTGNSLSILVQVFWGFASLVGAMTSGLVGNFGMTLVIRWNTMGESSRYLAEKSQLYINRGFYALLSVAVVWMTIWVYQTKRKEGVTIYGKLFKNRK